MRHGKWAGSFFGCGIVVSAAAAFAISAENQYVVVTCDTQGVEAIVPVDDDFYITTRGVSSPPFLADIGVVAKTPWKLLMPADGKMELEIGEYGVYKVEDETGLEDDVEGRIYLPRVDIDVDSNYDGVIDEDNDDKIEESSGGITATNVFREIKLAVYPSKTVLAVGKATLVVRSGVDKIKIWTDQNRTTEVKSGDDWDIASMPETLYVEGIKACDNMCDVSIALEYSRGSFTCDDLIKMTVIKVEVTNIKFNHTTTSSMYDAINIRQDYTNGYDISEGEWILGATNIPVCYTTNKAVTIKASFTVQPADITSADIWAVSTDSDGSLGDVVITNVTFSGGASSPKYVTFNVSGKTPSAIKKTTGDIWQWKMGNVNAPSPYVYSLNTSGVHTVYTILKEPVSPWVNTFGNTQNAWSTALDIVCSPAWAGGEASEIAAATGITKAINGSGRFKYDIASGAAMYIDGGSVTLSKCIQRLNGGNGAGELVNCTDCANFITIFANLIGGELYSSRMYTPGISFGTNPYSAIGRSAWTPPNWGWGFSYQEVGWTGNCGDGDLIFDPCLKVDGDGDPSALPQTELLPTGMMFSDGNQAAPFVYRERLASPGANGYGLCVARPTTKQRRSFK